MLLLYQGARFEFTLQGETRSLTWRGTRISTTFTYMPSHDLPAGEPYTEKIWLSVCEGEGRRAARAGAVAKRAGISATGYSVSFSVTPCATMPPAPPRDVQFYERTQWDFTITWRPPDISPGNDRPITKYALELSVFGASGTVRDGLRFVHPLLHFAHLAACCSTMCCLPATSSGAIQPPHIHPVTSTHLPTNQYTPTHPSHQSTDVTSNYAHTHQTTLRLILSLRNTTTPLSVFSPDCRTIHSRFPFPLFTRSVSALSPITVRCI